MYYNQSPTIIEPNDITALRSSVVETGADGVTIATLVVELRTDRKHYAPSPSLFLTDGVSPRLLIPLQSSTSDSNTATAATEVTPGSSNGKKTRMSRDERGEGV